MTERYLEIEKETKKEREKKQRHLQMDWTKQKHKKRRVDKKGKKMANFLLVFLSCLLHQNCLSRPTTSQ